MFKAGLYRSELLIDVVLDASRVLRDEAKSLESEAAAAYRQTVAPYGLSYNPARPRTYGLRVEYFF